MNCFAKCFCSHPQPGPTPKRLTWLCPIIPDGVPITSKINSCRALTRDVALPKSILLFRSNQNGDTTKADTGRRGNLRGFRELVAATCRIPRRYRCGCTAAHSFCSHQRVPALDCHCVPEQAPPHACIAIGWRDHSICDGGHHLELVPKS